MSPHQPSADAIPASTIYTLLGRPDNHIFIPIHFEKSIIMTGDVDFEPKGRANGHLQEFGGICGADA